MDVLRHAHPRFAPAVPLELGTARGGGPGHGLGELLAVPDAATDAMRSTAADGGQPAGRTTRTVGTGAPVVRDLFGYPVKMAPATCGHGPTPTAPTAPRKEASGTANVHLVRDITDEEVASFRALGVEVWLVPEYTGRRDRRELRIDHGPLLAAVCAAFPGSRILKLDAAAKDSEKKVKKSDEGVVPDSEDAPLLCR